MRVHFSALGCRLNEAEVERLSRTAVALGHEVVADVSQADWALINTCTVTHVAARKSRQAIRRLHQRAPEVRIAVLGCYGTMTPEVALSLPGVAMVIPNAEKERALRLIAEASDASGSATAAAVSAHPPVRRTRAFVKIQDGCDNHCTYCVVRIARGPARSRPYPEVLAEISQRITEGAREVVLTGVNIGSYGRDLVGHEAAGTVTLATMVARLLEETTIPRLRLSSLEPWDVDARVLALFADPRLCPHLHLPLQSGSDAVLRRMGRAMDVRDYRALVKQIRARVGAITLSTDLIVGFPGESLKDHEATLSLVEELALARLHVFRFSPRQRTPAALMDGQVPSQMAQVRARELSACGRALAGTWHREHVGRVARVLFESPASRDGQRGWTGLTENYLRVWVPSEPGLGNQIRAVLCTSADDDGLEGTLLAEC